MANRYVPLALAALVAVGCSNDLSRSRAGEPTAPETVMPSSLLQATEDTPQETSSDPRTPFSGPPVSIAPERGPYLWLLVHTDDALRVSTETTVERLREVLEREGVIAGTLTVGGPTQFQVDGVSRTEEARLLRVAAEAAPVFISNGAGRDGQYTFDMRPVAIEATRSAAIAETQRIVEGRLAALGMTDSVVARPGRTDDRLIVWMPAVPDIARIREIIRTTALLEFKLVEYGPFSDLETALEAVDGMVPAGMEIFPGVGDLAAAGGGMPGTVYYVVQQAAIVSGGDLQDAWPSLVNNQPVVRFTLSQDAGRRLGEITERNVGRRLAILLDNRVYSAPRIEGRITDEGQITGSFTDQEAQDLSLVLRTGALPASVTILEEGTAGRDDLPMLTERVGSRSIGTDPLLGRWRSEGGDEYTFLPEGLFRYRPKPIPGGLPEVDGSWERFDEQRVRIRLPIMDLDEVFTITPNGGTLVMKAGPNEPVVLHRIP